MDVVTNLKPLAIRRSCAIFGDVAPEPVFGGLNHICGEMFVVISVDIEVSDMVTEIGHVGLTLTRTAGIGWAHVSRYLADDIAKSHLIFPHLVLAVDLRDYAQIQMCPRMGGDLVALGVHAFNNLDKLVGSVDLAFVDVVSGDEESSFGVVDV